MYLLWFLGRLQAVSAILEVYVTSLKCPTFEGVFFMFLCTKVRKRYILALKCNSLGQSRLNSYTINCRIVAARVYLLSVFMVLGMYSFGNRLDIFLTWIDFQFQYLGNISMSLYLIHEALLRWMIFACRGSVSWSNLSSEDFGSNLLIPQSIMLLACHKKSYLICVEFSNFQNIT